MKKIYQIVTGVLVLACMYMIFSFSAQPAVQSGEISGGLCLRIVENTNELFHLNMLEQTVAQIADTMEYPIRKAAHMTEYAILAILCFAFYAGILQNQAAMCAAAFFTAALYACTDEWHQYFVPGRSAQVSDVCIDAAGAAIGIFFACFLFQFLRKHCKKIVFELKSNLGQKK